MKVLCECCDNMFEPKRSWDTICQDCLKEIRDYRAKLVIKKICTGGQEDKEITKAKFAAYYRKKHPARRCEICGKPFYVKGKTTFCDYHRSIWGMKLSERLWRKTNKDVILKEMKQEYAEEQGKVETIEPQVLSCFNKEPLQLGRC